MHVRRPLLLLACLVPLGACGDDEKSSDTTDAIDTTDTADTASDTASDTVDDTTPADTTPADTSDASDTHDDDVPTHLDDLGFAIRVPQLRTVPSEGFEGAPTTTQSSDIDHVCKVDVTGFDGYLYVRATPTSCRDFAGCEFTVSGAWSKVGDTIAPLAGATYDYGGNHHNDSIGFPSGDDSVKLYHSSFGFGFRSCHPPDCAQIYRDATLETNGCAADRSLPVTCVRIEDDGTEPPLVDDFEKCLGDPNR